MNTELKIGGLFISRDKPSGLMDILGKLTRHTCGELSCDECNAEREAASAEIARLRESLQNMTECAAELERANTTGAERLRFVLDLNARLLEAGHAMRHLHLAGKPCSYHAAIAAWDAAVRRRDSHRG